MRRDLRAFVQKAFVVGGAHCIGFSVSTPGSHSGARGFRGAGQGRDWTVSPDGGTRLLGEETRMRAGHWRLRRGFRYFFFSLDFSVTFRWLIQ